jgi:creatinine amidohydrolase
VEPATAQLSGIPWLGLPANIIEAALKGGEVVLSRRKTRQAVWAAAFLAALGCLVYPSPIGAQTTGGASSSNATSVPKMRSRLMTSLTGYEVAEYLKRNDVVFVPVGPVEVNGGNPTDVEYVIPLAYALKLAEKSDGLVMPYLAYFYPGSTTISPGTVMVSVEEGLPYLKALTRSLIRQGFRRIIFLTSHGPSGDTLGPLVRETFDETHVPVVWMDTGAISAAGHTLPDDAMRGRAPNASARTAPAGAPGAPASMEQLFLERKQITYGAYLAVGRLEDMPIGFSVPRHAVESDPSDRKLSRLLGNPGQRDYGRFYADPSEHGGWPEAVTAEQRAEWAKQGLALIDAQVAAYDVAGMLDALRQHDQFTKTLEKKYGDLLPPGPPRP